jgi:hypothetical protein
MNGGDMSRPAGTSSADNTGSFFKSDGFFVAEDVEHDAPEKTVINRTFPFV